MTKTTSRKSKSQCVGFVYGGIMKPNTLRFFKSESEDPTDYLEEIIPHYTKSVQSKYVNCDDSDELFEKFCDAYTNERKEDTDIFNVGIAAATAKLRDLSGAKGVHNFPKSSKKKDEDKEDDDNENEEQSDQEEDKKSSKKKEAPKKLVKKGKKEEKEDSADENSEEEHSEEEQGSEDEDEKKKSKKSSSKKKGRG